MKKYITNLLAITLCVVMLAIPMLSQDRKILLGAGGVAQSGPTTVAVDNFDRADGSLGANWTALEGDIDIVSNVATTTNNSFNVSYWSADAFANNQWSKLEFVTVTPSANAVVEVTVRVSGIAGSGNYSFYAAYVNGSTWGMYKTIAGVGDTVLIADTALGVVNGDDVEIRAEGTTISFYLNGTLVDSVTDATLTSGSAGFNIFASNDQGPLADNWSAGNR